MHRASTVAVIQASVSTWHFAFAVLLHAPDGPAPALLLKRSVSLRTPLQFMKLIIRFEKDLVVAVNDDVQGRVCRRLRIWVSRDQALTVTHTPHTALGSFDQMIHSRSSRVHRGAAAAAVIVPPFDFPPSLGAVRPDIWHYLESYHCVVSKDWNDFQDWHKKAATAAAQTGRQEPSAPSVKVFFDTYVRTLTDLAEHHGTQAQTDMQAYVRKYTDAMEFLDLWRYKEGMPTVQPLKQVERRVNIIYDAYDRVMKQQQQTSAASGDFYSISKDSPFFQP
ncbi:hypothetical protein EVG20_g461 [Dentipellis fragilis]|uniref:Uncharacterized protein n=1 Tax=Dentipellis fragilis TaxID=205917 RepID=A0A4Y9ZCI7_9AGAM|nr:hypothetical protein EVG20_g461 [Dentipellis fragilis]